MNRVVVAALVGAVAATAAVAAPAAAHPFGEPQRVELAAEGSMVTVRWSAPPDDLMLLGGMVGALPDRREIVFDTSPGSAPEPVGETDAERLVASEGVEEYLKEHVSVRQDDAACPVEVRLDELVDRGAELIFDCRSTVSDVEIGVSILTDVHEAYRTVAVGDGTTAPGRSLYTIDDDVRTWTFGSETNGGPSIVVVAAWGAIGLVVVLGVAFAARALTREDSR